MEKLNNLDYIMDENLEKVQKTSEINPEKVQIIDKNRCFCAACGREIGEGDHICSICKAQLKQD